MNNKKAWVVLSAGFLINMSLGVLYSWSVFSLNLTEELGWSKTSAALPYTIAIVMFALMMIPGGRMQDRFGGRKVAALGGLLTGLGFLGSGAVTTSLGVSLFFGLISGSGIGIAYAAVTPSVIRWFPDERKGLVTGIVVSGFGLSALYMAPLTNYLIGSFGIQTSFSLIGGAIILLVAAASQFLFQKESAGAPGGKKEEADQGWREIIFSKAFVMLWFMFLAGALGGLMVIGHLSKIASLQIGTNIGFVLVALTAISNASGRPLSGVLSDRIGRSRTMVLLSLAQGITMLLFSQMNSFALLMIGAAIVTFTYGGSFAVYPSAVSDYYGKKNFGRNYGILFSAWGLGGALGPLFAGRIVDGTGNYHGAYLIAGGLSLLSAAIGIAFYLMERKKS